MALRQLRTLLGSIYLKLALVLLFGATTMTLALVAVLVYHFDHAGARSEQLVQWGVAERIAARMEPLLRDGTDYWSLQRAAYDFLAANPKMRLFMLDSTGRALSIFSERGDERHESWQFNVATIKRFLADTTQDGAPHYISDPRSREKATFSAAPLRYRDGDGYLLVLLSGHDTRVRYLLALEDAGLRALLGIVILYVIAFITFEVYLFSLFTRRFFILTDGVRRFGAGEMKHRLPIVGNDEIDLLAANINHMAEVIEGNIRELERKDALRRELIENVAHDIRGPVAAMRAYTELLVLKHGSMSATELKEQLGKVLGRIEALGRLLGDLFALAKLEAREAEPKWSVVDVRHLFEDVADGVRPNADARRVALEVDVQPAGLKVRADRGMMERVLQNLVENAVRHTGEGGTVRLSARAEGGSVRIAVVDSGHGIEEQALPHIFERHVQGSAADAEHGAGGIGLAVVKRMVELHGSMISVESARHSGTTFSFRLGESGGAT